MTTEQRQDLSGALLPLRVTAVLAGWSGVLALVTSQLLPVEAGLVAATVLVAASTVSAMYGSPTARRLRTQIGLAVLVGALVYVLLAISDTPDLPGLSRALPPLLLGVLTAQGLSSDKRHDLMVAVTVGEFMIVLAAGISPQPLLAVPVLLGWLVGVLALVQSHQLHATDCAAPRSARLSPSAPERSDPLRQLSV
jgi:hypothetical protein